MARLPLATHSSSLGKVTDTIALIVPSFFLRPIYKIQNIRLVSTRHKWACRERVSRGFRGTSLPGQKYSI